LQAIDSKRRTSEQVLAQATAELIFDAAARISSVAAGHARDTDPHVREWTARQSGRDLKFNI
jgi:hypothetical protein